MKLKQITLAALTAMFVAGGAGIASAEGGISSAVSDEGSSAALQAEAGYGSFTGMNAQGKVLVQHRHIAPVKHHS